MILWLLMIPFRLPQSVSNFLQETHKMWNNFRISHERLWKKKFLAAIFARRCRQNKWKTVLLEFSGWQAFGAAVNTALRISVSVEQSVCWRPSWTRICGLRGDKLCPKCLRSWHLVVGPGLDFWSVWWEVSHLSLSLSASQKQWIKN